MEISDRTAKERQRRDYNNLLIEKLKVLLRNPQDGNLTIEQVLKRAHKKVTQLERESSSDPIRAGIFQGLSKVESLVIFFIESLKLDTFNSNECIDFVKKMFAIEYAGYNGSRVVSEGSTSKTTTFVTDKEMDRKSVKNSKEQNRRDRHVEGYNALEEFIRKSNISPAAKGKLQKVVILEVIIKYIKNKSQVDVHESSERLLQKNIGIQIGHKKGINIALQVFQKNQLLVVHTFALGLYLNSLNLQLTSGLPVSPLPAPLLPLSNSSTLITPPITPPSVPQRQSSIVPMLQQFQSVFPMGLPTGLPLILSTPTTINSFSQSPTGSSLTSSSRVFSEDSSNCSSQNSTVSDNPKRFFRPWC
ncbi:hypothetical protein GCK72_022916 [Caenorhabditis remanei]|uniref:BHLH domain-containing protein n=1 Tax=Caenorhabditis remanei TaxID=31234 RepID=A0A6A5FV03_CAERE|nr:hypothetical protein GCK72_022916 [Caenorhabditis remanei]KAF1746460.1 hypothetical protein GCK72_022916 [Caenorhabditis remanei]